MTMHICKIVHVQKRCFLLGSFTDFNWRVFFFFFFGVEDLNVENAEGLRSGVELVTSVSDKHQDLLRPAARYYSMFKGNDPI